MAIKIPFLISLCFIFIFQIEEYVVKEERDVPLILVGGAGCGKSSVLCRAAAVISAKAANDLKR